MHVGPEINILISEKECIFLILIEKLEILARVDGSIKISYMTNNFKTETKKIHPGTKAGKPDDLADREKNEIMNKTHKMKTQWNR